MSLVQNKNISNIRIAMIGSRNLEKVAAYSSQVGIYFDYCYQLAKAGVVMTSGLCLKGPDGLAQKAYAKAIDNAQILFIPGGFSAADEPDGSGKFIATVLRNERIKDSVHRLLERDGLVLGVCNGFQGLIKSGLLPYYIYAL